MSIPARLRPALTAAGLVVLLAVVAAASRTRLFHEGEPPVPASASRLLVDFGAYLLIAVLVLAMVVIAWALWPSEGYDGPVPPRRSPWHVFIQTLTLAVAMALLVAAVQLRRNLSLQPGQAGRAGAGGALAPVTGSAVPNVPPAFDWAAAGLVVLTLVVAAVIAWRRLRVRRAAARERRALARELAEVVADTLDDLRLDSDPRRAVIQAYARMERVLALHGLARRAAEAPREYLRRALREAAQLSPAALERLTGLFEEARFSTHPISTGMRADAVDALSEVRRELSVGG